jgi:hypothetical protein
VVTRSQSITCQPSQRKPPVSAVARRKLHTHQPDLFGFVDTGPRITSAQTIKWAMGVWRVSMPAHHSVLAERWAASRGIDLSIIDGDVLRFNPRLKNGDDRCPGLIWLVRDVLDDAPCGIVRLYIDNTGNVIGQQRGLGRTAFNAAIKLDADETVSTGLFVASNIEDGLKARAQGYRPLWIVNSLADLPVLNIDALTIITGASNAASTRHLDEAAAQAVVQRWRNSGCDAHIIEPPPTVGRDGGSFTSLDTMARGPP